jgi:hypothetical protein
MPWPSISRTQKPKGWCANSRGGAGRGSPEALTDVVRREVERERRKPRRESSEEFHRRIQAIVDDVKKLPVLDDRSPDQIIGYNEHGHFD